jgi:hypothetical protein
MKRRKVRWGYSINGKSRVYVSTIEGVCPMCGADAVIVLPSEVLAVQPDDTTHVCHPSSEPRPGAPSPRSRMSASGIYCTSYCNHGHRVRDGKPVAHECIVIPPKALALEIAGDIAGAIELLALAYGRDRSDEPRSEDEPPNGVSIELAKPREAVIGRVERM